MVEQLATLNPTTKAAAAATPNMSMSTMAIATTPPVKPEIPAATNARPVNVLSIITPLRKVGKPWL